MILVVVRLRLGSPAGRATGDLRRAEGGHSDRKRGHVSYLQMLRRVG